MVRRTLGQGMSAFRQIVILLCALLGFATLFQPSDILREYVLTQAGNPPYIGVWILIPHLFLYSTLAALACGLLWLALAMLGLLPPIELGINAAVVGWGVLGAIVALAITFGYFAYASPSAIHWIEPDPWKIGGNLFSNFFEEFIFRGFLLTALTAVFGFWPAALLTSVAFGAIHSQYPLPLQAMVAAGGFVWAVVKRQAASLWAPWVSHTMLDVIADSWVG
jgi:membrane protease YdiL (CAAX protease family)